MAAIDGGGKENEEGEAKVWQPSHDVGGDVQEVALDKLLTHAGRHTWSRVDTPCVRHGSDREENVHGQERDREKGAVIDRQDWI